MLWRCCLAFVCCRWPTTCRRGGRRRRRQRIEGRAAHRRSARGPQPHVVRRLDADVKVERLDMETHAGREQLKHRLRAADVLR